jgi:hypothetical protein
VEKSPARHGAAPARLNKLPFSSLWRDRRLFRPAEYVTFAGTITSGALPPRA